MRNTSRSLALLLLSSPILFGQGGSIVQPPLVSNSGTSNPATCKTGQIFFRTDATAGQNIYQCKPDNIWTQQLNSGSATGGGITVYSGTSLTVTANTYYFPVGGGGTPSTTETNVDVDSPSAATI